MRVPQDRAACAHIGSDNWVMRTSRDVSPPDGIFVKPYPSPSWAAVPQQLSNYNMVLPLPPHLKRPSTPPAEAPKLENEPQVKPEVKAEVVDGAGLQV